jgi:ATP-binding cassette subfamily B (MDR/TAP) protein 1
MLIQILQNKDQLLTSGVRPVVGGFGQVEHWKAVQWIFKYLRGISKTCLKFGKTGKGFVGYVDSDYAADLDKRRSLTGYVFTVGDCVVSWRATLQPVVAQSTTEAEYMAIT